MKRIAGSANYGGVKDSAVEGLMKADTRADLVAHVHALDRLRQHGYCYVPVWYLPGERVAWWKNIEQPATIARDGPSISTWWMKPGATAAKQ